MSASDSERYGTSSSTKTTITSASSEKIRSTGLLSSDCGSDLKVEPSVSGARIEHIA